MMDNYPMNYRLKFLWFVHALRLIGRNEETIGQLGTSNLSDLVGNKILIAYIYLQF